jgi:predicted house-cleaning noncanonical NTP pyrophosphatase (MazG superfamily)
MRTEYNKLVRDNIPDRIRASGRSCGIAVMSEAEYRKALLEKLVEESREAATAAGEALPTELADLREVFDAVLRAFGISPRAVEVLQAERRRERGGFDQRLRLLWTE